MRRGVNYQCLLLNPEHAQYTHPEVTDLKTRIITSRDTLCRMKAELDGDAACTGKMEIRIYNHMPYFAALCVDGASEHGHMFVTPYLHGVKNANAPAYLLNRRDHPVIFEKYWTSIQNQLRGAVPATCPPNVLPET